MLIQLQDCDGTFTYINPAHVTKIKEGGENEVLIWTTDCMVCGRYKGDAHEVALLMNDR